MAARLTNFRFSISGYPTLKFLKDDKWLDYDGPRTEEGASGSRRMRARLREASRRRAAHQRPLVGA